MGSISVSMRSLFILHQGLISMYLHIFCSCCFDPFFESCTNWIILIVLLYCFLYSKRTIFLHRLTHCPPHVDSGTAIEKIEAGAAPAVRWILEILIYEPKRFNIRPFTMGYAPV